MPSVGKYLIQYVDVVSSLEGAGSFCDVMKLRSGCQCWKRVVVKAKTTTAFFTLIPLPQLHLTPHHELVWKSQVQDIS